MVMAKVHHLTLKSAVEKYSPLHTAGATAEEVRAEIAKDEKAFDADAVNEIYAAITGTPENKEGDKPEDQKSGKKGNKSHIVISPFRCINNFDKQYQVGDDVSHFDAKRLEGLVANKIVEVQ